MEDFETMTAEQIASYRGPVFRATVEWWADGQVVFSDLESTSGENLRRKIEALRTRSRVRGVRYGEIVTETGIVIATDPKTGTPLPDDASKYIRPRA